jgi:hypothetical protein
VRSFPRSIRVGLAVFALVLASLGAHAAAHDGARLWIFVAGCALYGVITLVRELRPQP